MTIPYTAPPVFCAVLVAGVPGRQGLADHIIQANAERKTYGSKRRGVRGLAICRLAGASNGEGGAGGDQHGPGTPGEGVSEGDAGAASDGGLDAGGGVHHGASSGPEEVIDPPAWLHGYPELL